MSDGMLGPLISTHPAPLPSKSICLTGTHVTIVGIDPAHAPILWEQVKVQDSLFTFLFDGPYDSLDVYTAGMRARAKDESTFFYTILLNGATPEEAPKPVGTCSLMRIDTANRVVEVGNILFSPLLQRTRAATEAMYLLARYVFEDLGYRRYEWKCHNLNEPSKRAARRLGFKFEGVFRQHMFMHGRNRDTAWFSMLDPEWPQRKQAFESWLSEANFDAEGKQKSRLEDFRSG